MYATLTAELTLRTTKFEQGLEFVDSMMRGFTRANHQVQIGLNTKTIGQQIGQLKRAFGNMKVVVPVDVTVRVNGQNIVIEQSKAAANAIKAEENAAKQLSNTLKGITTNARAEKDIRRTAYAMRDAQRFTMDFNAHLIRMQALLEGTGIKGQQAGQKLAASMNAAAKAAQAGSTTTNQWRGGLDLLGGVAGRVGKVFASIANTISRWAIGYLFVSQMIRGIQSLQDATVGYSITLQRTTTSLTSMFGGSEKAAKSLLNQLELFAIRTSYNFEDLAGLTPQLVTAGVAAKDVIETLRALGDASVAGGKGIQGVRNLVGDILSMSSRGKVTGMDVRNFGANSIKIVKYLAQAYGEILPKGTKEAEMAMRSMITKGLIPADKAIKAIVAGIENDPLKAGQMAKQARTYEGAMSNIGDAIKRVLGGKAFASTFELMSAGAQKFVSFVSSPAFEKWGEELGPKLRKFAENAINLGAKMYELAALFARAVGWMYDVAVDKLPYIASLLVLLGSARVIIGIRTLGTTLMLAFGRALGPVLLVAAAITAFIAAYRNISEVQDVTEVVVGGTLTALKGLSFGIYKIWGELGAFIEKIGDLLVKTQNLPAAAIAGINALAPGTGIALNLMGGWGEGLKGFGKDQQGLEKQSAVFWDQIIEGWRNTGNAKFKALMNSDFGDIFKFDDVTKKFFDSIKDLPLPGTPKMPKYGKNDTLTNTANEQKKRAAALKKLQADQLTDLAKLYDMAAKASEDSAKRQLDALKSVADTLRGVFGSIQQDLAKFGVFSNSPLDALLTQLRKMANIGPLANGIATKAITDFKNFTQLGNETRSALEKVQGKDGVIPGAGAGFSAIGGTALGDRIGRAAVEMEGRATRFVKQCDRLADTTVRSVTSAFNKIMGPRGGDTAAKTMARFIAAGIGFRPTPGMKYQAGDIAYSGARYGAGSGHVMIVGTDGRFHDQYARNRGKYAVRPTTPVQWVVRPGGAKVGATTGTSSATAGNDGAASAVAGGDTVESFRANIREMLKGLKIDKLSLPPEWGKPVSDAAGNAHVFQTQMLLANENVQALMRALYGPKFADIVKKMREVSFVADRTIAGLQLTEDSKKAGLEFQAGQRARAGRNDPFFALRERYIKGGRLQIPMLDYADRIQEVKTTISQAVIDRLKEFKNALADRNAVLKLGRQFITGTTVDTYGLARAQELLNKKIEFRNTKDMVDLFHSDKKTFNTRLAEFARMSAGEYDLNKGEERRQSIVNMRAGFDQQLKDLGEQLRLSSDLKVGETQLNDALATRATILAKIEELQHSANGGFTLERATELANEIAAHEQRNRVMQREIELQGMLRSSLASVQDTLSSNSQLNALFGSMRADDPRMEMARARIGRSVELDRLAKDGKLGKFPNLNRNSLLGDFDATANSNFASQGIADSSARLAQVEYDLKVKLLEIERPLSEARKTALDFERMGAAASQQEADNRTKILETLQKMDSLAVDIWKKDQSRQDQLQRVFNPLARGDMQFRFDKMDAGWSDEQINAMLPVDRILRRQREAFDQMNGLLEDWRGSWQSMWRDIAQKGEFGLGSMLDSMTNRLAAWGADFLSSQAWNALQGLLGNFAGGILRNQTTPLTVPYSPSGGGGIAAGLANSGRGLFTTSSMQSDYMMRAAQSLATGGARQTAAMMGSGGGVYNDYSVTHTGDIKANNPAEYRRKMEQEAGNTPDSRRTVAKKTRIIGGIPQ